MSCIMLVSLDENCERNVRTRTTSTIVLLGDDSSGNNHVDCNVVGESSRTKPRKGRTSTSSTMVVRSDRNSARRSVIMSQVREYSVPLASRSC